MLEQGRIPPQAIEVEEAILGTVLNAGRSEAVDIVMERMREDYFYSPANREIFGIMKTMYETGKPIDLLSLENTLKFFGRLDFVGGGGHLVDITRQMRSEEQVDYDIQIVREMAMRRQLILSCNKIIHSSYDTTIDTMEVIQDADRAFNELTAHEEGSMKHISETMISVARKIDMIQEKGMPLGYRTGLDIDLILQGFQKSKLYFIGARPSMGKTALVMTMMRRFAMDGNDSGILSLETSDESLGVRLISQVSGIPAESLVSGQLSKDDHGKMINACSELSDLGIYIDDEPALNIQKIRSKCRLMKKKGVKIIFIDFLQLIVEQGRSKHEEVGSITKALKAIAKQLDIPIVALSQLSRLVERRNDKRPQLSDLRESGSIEEDADGILFLYRPEYYGITTTEDGSSTNGMAEIIVAKNKDGKTGVKRQRFIADLMKFENMAYQDEPVILEERMKNKTSTAPLPHSMPGWNDKAPF